MALDGVESRIRFEAGRHVERLPVERSLLRRCTAREEEKNGDPSPSRIACRLPHAAARMAADQPAGCRRSSGLTHKCIPSVMLVCMRTTVDLDDDVAVRLEELRKARNTTLRDLINEALRRGLEPETSKGRQRKRRFTQPVSAGRCLVPDLDDVDAALRIAEGDWYR